MSSNDQNTNPLLDFDLLSRLIVGIGEVAELAGVPTRQLRYWEEKGIIESLKVGEGAARRYDYLNIKRILLIKELLDDGYTLEAAAKKVEDRMHTLNEAFKRLGDISKNL